MIETMISAGTPYSFSARARSSACLFQKSTPRLMRASLMKIGRYSFHCLTRSAGREIASRIDCLRFTSRNSPISCSPAKP